MMQAVQMAGNPVAALQQMASNNPMMKQALTIVQQNGGDAQSAFERLAMENGIDPAQIMSMLK